VPSAKSTVDCRTTASSVGKLRPPSTLFVFVAVRVIAPAWLDPVAWVSRLEPASTVICGVLKPMFRNGLLGSGFSTVIVSAPESPCDTPVR